MQPPYPPYQQNQPKEPWHKNTIIIIAIANVAVIAALIGGYALAQTNQPSAQQNPATQNPTEGDPLSPQTSETVDEGDNSSQQNQQPTSEVRLRDMEPVGETYLVEWYEGSVGLGPVKETLFLGTSIDASAEYRLDRNFSTLKATVGYNDSGPSNWPLEFWVADEAGNVLFPKTTFKLGDSRKIEVDVSSAIRIFLVVGRGGDPDRGAVLGIVDGVLIRK